MAEVAKAQGANVNPSNAMGGRNRKSILDIERQMNRIAANTSNLDRYWQARRIANQYERNINERLDANGYTGNRFNLAAPRYVYRYGNRN